MFQLNPESVPLNLLRPLREYRSSMNATKRKEKEGRKKGEERKEKREKEKRETKKKKKKKRKSFSITVETMRTTAYR